MSVVVNEFEVVTAPSPAPAAAAAAQGTSPQQQSSGPWAAYEVAQQQRRLAERAARLEAH